jgi:hypothetical protein
MSLALATRLFCAGVTLGLIGPLHAQTEIRLWPGHAPGSEDAPFPESITRSASGDRIVMNVSDPTLTAFLPDPAAATGAAVVIAPGGALRVLAFDDEGVKAAKWLNERGIAGFVLKYRTLQQDPSAPRAPLPGMPAPGGAGAAPRPELVIVNANANPAPSDAALGRVLELAVGDAQPRSGSCAATRPNGTSIRLASASWAFRRAAASRSGPRSRRSRTPRPIFSSRSTARRCRT